MFCICPNARAHDSKLLFDPLHINYKAMTYDKTERKEKKPKTNKKKNKLCRLDAVVSAFFPLWPAEQEPVVYVVSVSLR